jgi:vacuolar protein sorting-associated protein 13A/C
MVPNPEADESPFTTPKVKLNLNLEKLALGITRLQYQDLIQLVETMGRMSRGVPYRKYRPYGISKCKKLAKKNSNALKWLLHSLGYRGHAKEWWNFAYQCVLETEVRRRKQNWSWEHIKGYREKYRSYAEVRDLKFSITFPWLNSNTGI